MPIIWEDAYLSNLLSEAEKRIASDLDLHFEKYALTINADQSTYGLDPSIKKVLYITWEGKKLEPMDFNEANNLMYNRAVVSETVKNEYSSGIPRYYTVHPTNLSVIRLIPTPNSSKAPTGLEDLWDATEIRQQCIVTCYRTSDPTDAEFALPDHLGRRYKKHYALYRAFLKEGKGQNLVASNYHKTKFRSQFETLKLINANTYVSKRNNLEPSDLRSRGGSYPMPQLPSNYPGRKV
jgi:hypothetical protein